MTAFDWPALMRVAFRDLRLSPDAFWALSPAEFALLLGRPESVAPLTRHGLDALLKAYPDQKEGNEND